MYTHTIKWLVVLSFIAYHSVVSADQYCNKASIVETAPTARFSINGAIALDHATGFEWTRCPLGHVFDDNGTPDNVTDDECTPQGATRTTWQSANSRVSSINSTGLAGYDGTVVYDWRMPNIKELATVVERACTDPARNLEVFPLTVAYESWSSTLTAPYTGNYYDSAYAVFRDGRVIGSQVYTDPLDYELSGTNNDTEPSRKKRVYAVRGG